REGVPEEGMYDRGEANRTAQHLPDAHPGPDPAAAGRLALGRVRKLLTAYLPGMACDPARLEGALAAPLPEPALEGGRPFALGSLRGLGGDWEGAERLLAQAVARARRPAQADGAGEAALHPLGPEELLARAAYWRARLALLCGHGEGVAA